MMVEHEKQELYCHNCDRYIQFNLDEERDGAHEIKCPNCGHIHCRIVENGKVTEARWDSRNGGWIGTTTGLFYGTSYVGSGFNLTTSGTSTSTAADYQIYCTTAATTTDWTW